VPVTRGGQLVGGRIIWTTEKIGFAIENFDIC
jgi:hypothetical protein